MDIVCLQSTFPKITVHESARRSVAFFIPLKQKPKVKLIYTVQRTTRLRDQCGHATLERTHFINGPKKANIIIYNFLRHCYKQLMSHN